MITTRKIIKAVHRAEGIAVGSSKSLPLLRPMVCRHRGATETELTARIQVGGTKTRPLFIMLQVPNMRSLLQRRMMKILMRMSRR